MAKNKQNEPQNSQSKLRLVSLAVLALSWAYIFASLAIDKGSLVFYALAFASTYYALYFLIQAFKKRISYDKTTTTRRARKAH